MGAFRTSSSIGQTDTAKSPKGAVSVGAASVEIVPANGARVEVTICNDHATQVVYLALGGTAVANQGIRLNAAGGSYTSGSFSGQINAIATGAATNVTFSEV